MQELKCKTHGIKKVMCIKVCMIAACQGSDPAARTAHPPFAHAISFQFSGTLGYEEEIRLHLGTSKPKSRAKTTSTLPHQEGDAQHFPCRRPANNFSS